MINKFLAHCPLGGFLKLQWFHMANILCNWANWLCFLEKLWPSWCYTCRGRRNNRKLDRENSLSWDSPLTWNSMFCKDTWSWLLIICWNVSLNLVRWFLNLINGYPLNRVNILELSWHDMKKRIRKLETYFCIV